MQPEFDEDGQILEQFGTGFLTWQHARAAMIKRAKPTQQIKMDDEAAQPEPEPEPEAEPEAEPEPETVSVDSGMCRF
eukprot:SAG11_NODE_3754_length_2250_cov_6.525802_2_plen_77_part_00